VTKPRRIIISEADAILFHQLARVTVEAINSMELLGDEFMFLARHLDWKNVLAVNRGSSENLPVCINDLTDTDWQEIQMAIIERAQFD
jgi:hypothetical protein